MADVKLYFLEPGMVSRVKRRRERGSVWRSRGLECMEPRSLEGKKEVRLLIVADEDRR